MITTMSKIDEYKFVTASLLFTAIVLVFALGAHGKGLRYEIQANLDEEGRIVSGVEKVTFTNTLKEEVDEVVFALRANLLREPNPNLSKVNQDSTYPGGFNPGWTNITEPITEKGEQVDYTWESSPPAQQTYSLDRYAIRVELSQPLAPGEETSLTVPFSTKIPFRNAMDEEYYKDTYIWRFGWYPILAPASWWKGYDEELYGQTKLPSGDFSVNLEVPDDYQMAGGERIESSQTGKDGDRKTVAVELKGARSFPLVTGPRYKRYHEEFKDYVIDVLYYPGYEEEARVLASYANEILTYYSEEFGDYRREGLTFAQGPTTGYYGLAADGTIVLGSSFFTEGDLLLDDLTKRLSEYLVAHEIAHQWFGIGVGADLNSQNWLSEAFAEFLSLRYFEDRYSEDEPNLFKLERPGLISNMVDSQLGYMNLRKHMFELQYVLNYDKGFDEAVIKPIEDVEYGNASQTRLYKKGYLILRTLESIVGEKTMTEIIKKTYELHKDDIIDATRFAEIVRSTSERELPDDFFDEWLYTDGYMDYGIRGFESVQEPNGEYENNITVFKAGSLTAPTALKLKLESGETVEKPVTLEGDQKEISVTTPEKVVKVTVDPGQEVMDVNRLNNHFPREVEVSFGGNKLPLDAYFLSVGLGTVTGRVLNRATWAIGPGLAQGVLNLNRNVTLSGQVAVQGGSLSDLHVEGGFGARYNFWSTPDTGFAYDYWVQDKSVELQYGRAYDDTEDTSYNLFGVKADLSNEIEDNWSLSARLQGALSGFGKLSVSASERTRLFPNVYLDLDTSLGVGFGEVPRLFAFELTELNSFGEYVVTDLGLTGWEKNLYPGTYKLFSRLTANFPIFRDRTYYLGTLATISDVRQGVFFSIGDTWDQLDQFTLDDLKFEGGIELTVSGKTLGGLFPFDLTLGYAYHGQDVGRPFLSFSLGL